MSFYVTTPIYYVNDAPHLGHAYTTIVADALARFHRMTGEATRFLTGTDEHGLKIEQAAARRGMKPLELADDVVTRFESTWRNLEISNDDFIRTTEARHKKIVGELWRNMKAAGDIYLGAYEGWYCIGCETYYPESQLEGDRLCPTHKSATTWQSEPTYLFKLGDFQQRLLDHIERHPEFIQPENYRNEVVSFVKSGLRDLSVSRTTFQWGIPVPDDPAHVIYVWIDALTNYYSALSDAGGADLRGEFWAADNRVCHLIGKDILKFHAVYWPCMLMSAGLPLPRTILCHGWWTVRGEKISKSMPATRVDPNRLAADLGADALRFFLLREVPLGLDGDFSYEALFGRYNAELANDLGNLVSRTVTLTEKFAGGVVPDAAAAKGPAFAELARASATALAEADEEWRAFAPSRALEAALTLVRAANGFLGSQQPWTLAKDPARKAEVAATLRATLEAIALAAHLLAPVMPSRCRTILRGLGIEGERPIWPADASWRLRVGAPVRSEGILFPRLDDKQQAAFLDAWIPADARAATPEAKAAPAAAAAAAPVAAPVSVDDFGRIDLRVAEIKTAEPIKGAKKLLRLEVDVGEGRLRQVVAGIAESYEPGRLVGRKVILVANLHPATIRGVTSEGMILAAGDARVIGLSAIDVDVPPGTKIR